MVIVDALTSVEDVGGCGVKGLGGSQRPEEVTVKLRLKTGDLGQVKGVFSAIGTVHVKVLQWEKHHVIGELRKA